MPLLPLEVRMGDTVKILVGEINGEEKTVPTEKLLAAADCFFASEGIAATDAEEAIKEVKAGADAKPRYTVPCIMNGIMGNDDWITYSNLTPDSEIVVPFDSILEEVTYANSRNSVEFDIEFYKNTRVGTPYATREVRSGSENNGIIVTNDSFAAGDRLNMKYKDQGTNAADLVLMVFFRVT